MMEPQRLEKVVFVRLLYRHVSIEKYVKRTRHGACFAGSVLNSQSGVKSDAVSPC